MALNNAYLNAIAAANPITHIRLVNEAGTEVGDGRKAVAWTGPSSGDVRITEDKVYAMTEGQQAYGWEGFDAATAGTSYGIVPLANPRTFANDGTYTLTASETGVNHNAVGS